MIILKVIIFILILEFLIQILIKLYKIKFKWFITNEDEIPKFDKIKFNNFLSKSFDHKLGWKQKLDSSGFLKKSKRLNTSEHYRNLTNKNKIKLIASFGDSYVFSNHMNDKNTWEEQMSKKKKFNVLNYGVGNYGLDQAILKYENINLPKAIKIVIMGFVPETITRIQTSWKHYTEFGNINGFKPRFDLVRNKLVLRPNPINSKTKPNEIRKIILKLKKTERFYKDRFVKYKFQFPYMVTFFRNFKFNLKILSYLLISDIVKIIKNDKIIKKIENSKFYSVIERNVKEAHYLYTETHSKKLLSKLIAKFEKIAYKKGHLPLIVIFPQPQDINLKSSTLYKNFFKDLSKNKDILDLSNYFTKENYTKYYLNDKYGGHLNKNGNIYVGKIITKHLKTYLKKF